MLQKLSALFAPITDVGATVRVWLVGRTVDERCTQLQPVFNQVRPNTLGKFVLPHHLFFTHAITVNLHLS
jgi:hypothetical protein